MAEGTFVTAITCVDGRVQQPIWNWMTRHFDADYVDLVTVPGPDGILAGNDIEAIASIRRGVELSVRTHGSRVVAVVAHHDCAGSPVTQEEHVAHLERAATLIRSWRMPVRVVTLWVDRFWDVDKIEDTGDRT